MALSLLEDWCRLLGVDVRRALLVTGIPEGLEQAAVEATLQPAFQGLGAFKLRSTRTLRKEKAKAALVEFVGSVEQAAVPREIPSQDGVWRVLCKDRVEDSRVLRQMKRLLLDERPPRAQVAKVPGDTTSPLDQESQAPPGSGQSGRRALSPLGIGRKARRGRRGRGSRARSNRLTKKGKKRGRGGRPATLMRSESEDSSDESLGIVIEELEEDEDEDQKALYATLQAAARELIKKWGGQDDRQEGDAPREFLALVTVKDKTKTEEAENEPPPSAESNNLEGKEDKNIVPDLVALLAVRDTPDEETMESDASESEDQENDGVINPEFVAIVAYTDPSDPSAREEMLKIASVIESLGWSEKKDKREALPEVLAVMTKDTSGIRVKVKEAGREVDAMVLRNAKDDGKLLECISTLADPETPSKEKKPNLLKGWANDGPEGGGLLELVALLAAQDMAEVMKEEKENAWEGGKFKYAKGNLGEVLALLAAREILESGQTSSSESSTESDSESSETESSESDDSESEESGPEDRASRKPRAKRARTAARNLGQAGGRASAQDDGAGSKKKKANPSSGPHGKASETKSQPPAGSRSVRGKKVRRGRRLPPKCR
ncbi:PREDICTED: nucleolar and coiled-body phosphoprotein 1-like [Elephantulus edwardii]|uniref:nucleolar and coiled-body phosphoprotein 1-like n=1 Tax=Elephantulus edwardii TaxID=28737 RepID=UPI0003F07354|nr:PREDICTED: nucleolar and coiled-body phosphoprotein 1-like [Elephantulus edwardii]